MQLKHEGSSGPGQKPDSIDLNAPIQETSLGFGHILDCNLQW